MIDPSSQVAQQLEASEALLMVMLAERPGPLNEVQREFLASTLARVQHAAALLQAVLADAMDSLDASIVGNPATIPKQRDPSLSP